MAGVVGKGRGKGRELYLNNNKILKYLIKKENEKQLHFLNFQLIITQLKTQKHYRNVKIFSFFISL